MLAALIVAAALSASAAPAPARAHLLSGEELDLKAVDGWALKAVWRKAASGKATIVLLHGTGQRKEDWRVFGRALARAGYGYAAVDLRGHGESRTSPSGEEITYKKLRAVKGANDYEDMTRDAEAVVTALTEAGVAEETIGVAGAEVGSSIAVKYAAVHPQVPFVIMLSPGLAWQEIPLVNAVRAFKGRPTPFLMVHSEADKRSAKETPLLYAFAKNAVGESNTTLVVVAEERGTRLFTKNKGFAEKVVAWLSDPHPSAVTFSTAAAPGEPGAPDIDADVNAIPAPTPRGAPF